MPKPNVLFKETLNHLLDRLKQDGSSDYLSCSQNRLANELGVSRTTVRACIKHLEKSAILDRHTKGYVLVRTPRASDYFDEEELTSRNDLVKQTFLERILRGNRQPGERISELELARETGTSTATVREFLIQFSRFGLIEKRRQGGWLLGEFDEAFARELADIRELFEFHSALAFIRLPVEDALWEELDQLMVEHELLATEIQTRFHDFSDLDRRFHELLQRASQNRFIRDFHDVIVFVFHYHYQWNKTDEKERNKTAINEHLALMRALKTRDWSIVKPAIDAHLASARKTLFRSIQPPPDLSETRG